MILKRPYLPKQKLFVDYLRSVTSVKELDEQMKKEIEDGIIADPNMPVEPHSGMPLDQIADPMQNPNAEMSMGKPFTYPDLDSSSDKATDAGSSKATDIRMPKGGEI